MQNLENLAASCWYLPTIQTTTTTITIMPTIQTTTTTNNNNNDANEPKVASGPNYRDPIPI